MHIKTVVYIDVLLLVNFTIALFLLLSAGVLSNQITSFVRLVCGGLVATFSTLVLFVPELPLLLQVLYQGASAALVAKIAYGATNKRLFCQTVSWYFLLNLLLTGFVTMFLLQSKTTCNDVQTNNMSVYLYVPPILLVGCVSGTYLIVKICVFCFGAPSLIAPQPLIVKMQEQTMVCNAFYDTGFALKDPFSQRRVLLVSLPAISGQLAPDFLQQLTQSQCFATLSQTDEMSEEAVESAIANKMRYLYCSTVTGQKLLPAICVEYIYRAKNPGQKIENILLAFCQEPVSCNGCNALFGADLANEFTNE